MVAATTLCVREKLRYGHSGAAGAGTITAGAVTAGIVTAGIVTVGGFFTM